MGCVFVIALLGAGCGSSTASPGSQASPGVVYRVSLGYEGVPLKGAPISRVAWVDPSGNRDRELAVAHVSGSSRGSASTLAVVEPGASLWRMDGGRRGWAHTQTDLGFGVEGWQAPALEVVRAYLGLSSPLRGAVAVRHHDGRVVLVTSQAVITRRLPYPNVAELPSPYDLLSKEDREGDLVVTLLGTITHRTAQARGLFRVNPDGRGVTTRKLVVGQAPVDVTPAYWLGPRWQASSATSATVSHAAGRPATSDVTYTSANGDAPLDLDTGEGSHPGFPGTATPIRLADGTPAKFWYSPPFPDFRGSSSNTSATATFTVFSAWVFAPSGYRKITKSPNSGSSEFPPFITVTTKHSTITITINAPAILTRREALQIARGLRPI